jgi:chemotaxis protein CheY-P-specific phosphatase CheC
MQQVVGPTSSQRLTAVLLQAVSSAGEQLSRLMEREIQLQGTNVTSLRLDDLPALLNAGGEDRVMVAVHLSFAGDADGHVVLTFSPQVALQLVSYMMVIPINEVTMLVEMERSILGEGIPQRRRSSMRWPTPRDWSCIPHRRG